MNAINHLKQLFLFCIVIFAVSACSSGNEEWEVDWEKTIAEIIRQCDGPDIQPGYMISALEGVGFAQDIRHEDINDGLLESEIISLLDFVEEEDLSLSELNQCLYEKFIGGNLSLREKYVFYNLLKLNIQAESN